MDKLVRVDRNGTEYWESNTCPKCGGKGYIPYFNYVEGGVCFECGGTGHKHHAWKIYTPEHAAKLEAKRIARYKVKAPERNEKKLWSMGFDNGSIHVVLGETYSIKDELKAAGARFSPNFGWFFVKKPECQTVEIMVEDVFETNDATGDLELKSDVKEIVDAKKREASPSVSKHLHEVGDKIEVDVELKNVASYHTNFTYYGELNYIYIFEDAEGNVYVWKTSKFFLDDELDGVLHIKGTVKENGEYKGVKQTVLTRCKIAMVG